MSASDAAESHPRRRGGEAVLTVALFASLIAALLAVVRVVKPGGWLLGAVAIAALVLAAGFIARRYRLPAVAVSLIEAGVWVLFMTIVFLRETALLWIVPTPETLRRLPELFDDAMQSIVLGAAPLEETLALGLLIVGAMGLLAIIVDHVVLTARMPLLAAVGIVTVGLIPAIAVPGRVDVMGFVIIAVSILFLLRAETRSRDKPLERDAERTAGVPATALGIGAIAIVVAVVATPLLPQPGVRPGSGVGPGAGIDATLQLGDDLRRPQEVEVLRVRSNAPVTPYLRATTLSRFEGGVWEPDRVRTVPLESELALGEVSVASDVRLGEYITTVEIVNLASTWLPVAYPATEVTGLDGDWAAVPYNRTIVAESASSQGQTYEVVTSPPRPTLEQIRAIRSTGPEQRDETTELPADTPAIITELAAEVTAGLSNDYDRLIALQRWFRTGDFRYSLDAPVEEGFDGSGTEAVAEFLEKREGYCIHFASAFALMARTLHIPSRIVVGYLPGVANGEVVDSETVYSVTSSKLHAWPEVFFEGIGWVAFEPTTGLGMPTAFSPASGLPGTDADADTPIPGATPAPSSTAPADRNTGTEEGADAIGGGSLTGANPLPMLGIITAIALLLAVPAVLREVRRRQLIQAGHGGDAGSAWTLLQNAAIDVGIAVPATETPRAFAHRLVEQHGVSADSMITLVTAIERASYAPPGVRGYRMGAVATDAALAVSAELLAGSPPARRILAIVAPRSLIVRPGSVYAGSTSATR
ncbi:hypothetical protein ASD56_12535 [Microbacterium sp. Root166]|uniref:transglutaminase family protein n=1 Tax=Microbacterium sp. Root166 TaxID=1736478 RepID=UPI0006FC6B63|nr:DUF3488 and transglutaminase-like domain-containing protein [Microbacterium sp. Root166]KQZ83148.1 hypothetical protein ASD56_12535 [Microbacterium sp. Root166]